VKLKPLLALGGVAAALGVGAWLATVPSPTPPPSAAPAASGVVDTPRLGTPSGVRAPAERPSDLYSPTVHTDRVSVAGEPDPVYVGGMTQAEIDKLRAARPPPPSAEARAAGESEKQARREEARLRREARRRGEDPGGSAGRSSPGELVNEAQDRLDAEADEVPPKGP
jgi:hypothetical protein